MSALPLVAAATFTGPTAAAVLDARDGCVVTRAWVWAADDLHGDTAARVYGTVHDTCRGRRLARFSGEAAGVAFTSGRRAARLDADVPIETVDLRTRAVSTHTAVLHVDWAAGAASGRSEGPTLLDWGDAWLRYPEGGAWRVAETGGSLDGDALSGTWGYLFDGKFGKVEVKP
ncbi:MAG: hypothetical protein ACOZNI_03240 [Myxococcota bacterium]